VRENEKSLFLITMMIAFFLTTSSTTAAKPDDKGFDEFGYNYQARIFVGSADGVDRLLDGKVWGDPTYANDHLKMK